ncbi:MAG: hypothetical protein JST54_13880 [Deltaproteobacteria bacterium]|nr:hypothetical protein [Deltaproteobacteria bacterium]
MAKPFEKAVTGFNHNIKHKGKAYHVQTEDSGVSTPHIITHLFVGGNILATKKTSYADILGASDLPELVRQLMEEQHKEMLRNLVSGTYDEIDAANADKAKSYQPGVLDTGSAPKPLNVVPTAPIQAKPKPAASPIQLTTIAPPSPFEPKPLPPEVIAARELQEAPKIIEEGAETLFGEDLISEKSLDEVILQYLSGEQK